MIDMISEEETGDQSRDPDAVRSRPGRSKGGGTHIDSRFRIIGRVTYIVNGKFPNMLLENRRSPQCQQISRDVQTLK